MTIIAGFCCDNGIVMCSDTEKSNGYLKGSVQKLIPYQKDWCTAAMGGAGNSELIDALFEQVKERLDLEHADMPAIVAELKDVVLSFHEREVRAYPATDNEKRVETLIALRPKSGELALFETAASVFRPQIKTFSVIGTGMLIRHTAQRLYRSNIPVQHGIHAAIHILEVAKQNILGCGENSHVLVLRQDGSLSTKPVMEIMAMSYNISAVEGVVRGLMFATLDDDISKEQFEEELQGVSDTLRAMKEQATQDEAFNKGLAPLLRQGLSFPFDIQGLE